MECEAFAPVGRFVLRALTRFMRRMPGIVFHGTTLQECPKHRRTEACPAAGGQWCIFTEADGAQGSLGPKVAESEKVQTDGLCVWIAVVFISGRP